ncbi:ribose-5-phosphate isomerase RpiA [Roseiarcaceae bacterium H3SJ34-1]|uniref:ribose-5-phosphate isomerase RpiA n=1 Tax=Terripilifer ovatus TaxID=3032367 RepID=UPI003AB92619|nr:ribose-5-phosphate isomerase RpiA [Roseiarcaceae bacterium H3SJ34-1]
MDNAKRMAAERAAEFVRDGMRLGLGTGSTAAHFVDCVGERVAAGTKLICVPTSEATRKQAEKLGIPLSTLDETPELDLTVDGADEFDQELRLIKGGGGALLREKIVANASERMIVITDASKSVARLGRFPLPVEIVPFGAEATRRAITRMLVDMDQTGAIRLRMGADGLVFVTDGGHYIFDCALGSIADPDGLARALHEIPGVVEHGLFLGLADAVIVAGDAGIKIIGNPGP